MTRVMFGLAWTLAIAIVTPAALGTVGVTAVRNESAILVSGDADSIPAGTDELTFRITSLTGADAAAGTGLTSITGTFTVSGTGTPFMFFQGSSVGVGQSATQYPSRSTNFDGDERETPAESFVNFPAVVGTFARSPDAASTTSLTGGWFTSGVSDRLLATDSPTGDFFDNQVLARIYVTPGANVSFTGQYSSANASGPVSTNQNISFSSVPEPASLGLLGLCATGLLARRRRDL